MLSGLFLFHKTVRSDTPFCKSEKPTALKVPFGCFLFPPQLQASLSCSGNKKTHTYSAGFSDLMWRRADSNRRPLDCQSSALAN